METTDKNVVLSDDTTLPPLQESALANPADMLRAAIEHGIDAAGIKTLSEVYERMEARRAEREFNDALSEFQRECPIILKKKEIEFPTKTGGMFRSRYAEMDTIVEDTRELRGKHGFSHSFEPELTDKQVKAVCILRHRGGHHTRTPFAVPIPKDFKLSEAHAIAGAITFCERYAFRGALGITTGPDHDGKEFTESNKKMSEEQRQTLALLVEETQAEGEAFRNFLGVPTLADLPARDYGRVQQALLQRKDRMRKAKKSEETS